jgi:hypothetical protein
VRVLLSKQVCADVHRNTPITAARNGNTTRSMNRV